ncbi:DUF421 domain-containing protein [Altericroceibacterium endophyticum]|uniref:DUF421 domain-containing protein n=1 Tax=Altericroceibacterium endophyticum TaxID=1808508 RepID=A0A6I4T792_9SPHN|nr:YetF domain-containing protein [Altericroceibacterium endophyticum]MXO66538.1 DUF421 domain-containing protein [Altericroceibacterium endophyticum]
MFIDPPFDDSIIRGFALAPIALLWVIFLVRMIGLRAFSKMTAFDFIVTLATGSLLANAATVTSWRAFIQTVLAIAVLLIIQYVLAWLRRYSGAAERAMGNEPLLLMRDGEFCEEALRKSRVDRSDVYAKLREANALELSKVRAVVLETTGDISVLHGDRLDSVLLDGVRGAD